jgi:hypothetical protein
LRAAFVLDDGDQATLAGGARHDRQRQQVAAALEIGLPVDWLLVVEAVERDAAAAAMRIVAPLSSRSESINTSTLRLRAASARVAVAGSRGVVDGPQQHESQRGRDGAAERGAAQVSHRVAKLRRRPGGYRLLPARLSLPPGRARARRNRHAAPASASAAALVAGSGSRRQPR